MYFIRPPYLLKRLYKEAIWRMPDTTNAIYLTFDDGPVPEITTQVLDILKQYQIKATFFCVGENVAKHYSIYKRILDEGHAVGNHTFHHLNGWETGTRNYIKDVIDCAVLVDSKLFRPPYGKLKRRQSLMISKKYKIYLWDVLSGDFDPGITAEQCFQNVVQHTRPGSIIVFHDSTKAREKLLYALPKTVELLLSKNFVFATLPG